MTETFTVFPSNNTTEFNATAPTDHTPAIVAGCVFGILYVAIVASLTTYCILKRRADLAARPPPDDTLEAIFQRQQTAAALKLPAAQVADDHASKQKQAARPSENENSEQKEAD